MEVAVVQLYWGCSKLECKCINVPQSAVLGHGFGAGLVSGLQPFDESQVTAPGVPDWPFPTPHFVVTHPVGSACTQLPKEWDALNNRGEKVETETRHNYRCYIIKV